MSMLNATKFVVAGAIVALFSGLMLSGLLIQADDDGLPAAASPSPTADLLSTLVTKEVAPGIQRLTADSFGRNLRGLLAVERSTSGPVWLIDRDGGRWRRLDAVGRTIIDVQQHQTRVASLPDGSMVMLAGPEAYLVPPTTSDAALASGLAAAISITPELPSRINNPTAAAGTADGSVWASWTGDGGLLVGDDTRVLQYLDGEWQDHSGADGLGGLIDLQAGGYVCDITETTDGAVYVGVCGYGASGTFSAGGLFRYVDGRWERVPVFAETGRSDILASEVFALASGHDGTLWATTLTTTPRIAEAVVAGGDWSVLEGLLDEEMSRPDAPRLGPWLLKLQDGRWSAYAWHDIEPDSQRLPWQWNADEILAVDADGVLWFGSPETTNARREVTLGSYDGEEVRWYPEVGSARDVEIGPDGHPWIAAADGIYVIDPAEVQRDLDEPGPE